jgi:hypothetical protein
VAFVKSVSPSYEEKEMTNQITTNPCKPKTKINTAFSLDLAGWIMARYKNQRLVKVDLWEQEGRIGFACDFETAPEEKCDYREFTKLREEQPEELKKTVAAGLQQLACHLNRLMKESDNVTALNTNQKQPQESAEFSIALNTNEEVVRG